MSAGFEQLFRGIEIGAARLPSRIVMPGMQRGRAENGHLLPEMIDYYASRARAGVGMIVGEGCCVDHWSSIWDGNFPRIAPDTVTTWARCAGAVHDAGAAMILQISHPGAIRSDSQAMPGRVGPALSASGIYKAGKKNGRAATIEDLREIRDAFADAARLAMEAGMDGVEVHACHGFFLDEFLWAETNLRRDRYGGRTIAERMVYPVEVVAAVRSAIGPDAILSVRISQWKEMDYDAQIVSNPAELRVLLEGLEKAGANLLHPSCRRFYDSAFRGSDLSLAGWCKAVSELPVITVGSVGLPTDVMSALVGTDSDGLELSDSLAELARRFGRNEFDLVAVGRSLIADPEWALKVRTGNLAAIRSFRKEDLGKALEMEPEAIKEIHR